MSIPFRNENGEPTGLIVATARENTQLHKLVNSELPDRTDELTALADRVEYLVPLADAVMASVRAAWAESLPPLCPCGKHHQAVNEDQAAADPPPHSTVEGYCGFCSGSCQVAMAEPEPDPGGKPAYRVTARSGYVKFETDESMTLAQFAALGVEAEHYVGLPPDTEVTNIDHRVRWNGDDTRTIEVTVYWALPEEK